MKELFIIRAAKCVEGDNWKSPAEFEYTDTQFVYDDYRDAEVKRYELMQTSKDTYYKIFSTNITENNALLPSGCWLKYDDIIYISGINKNDNGYNMRIVWANRTNISMKYDNYIDCVADRDEILRHVASEYEDVYQGYTKTSTKDLILD